MDTPARTLNERVPVPAKIPRTRQEAGSGSASVRHIHS